MSLAELLRDNAQKNKRPNMEVSNRILRENKEKQQLTETVKGLAESNNELVSKLTEFERRLAVLEKQDTKTKVSPASVKKEEVSKKEGS